MQERPAGLPGIGRDGDLVKNVVHVLLERQMPTAFTDDPVAEEFVGAIVRLATQAPSSYNLQPWRFIVVRDQAGRARLRRASRAPVLVFDAPVLIVALGMKEAFEEHARAITLEAARRGAHEPGDVDDVVEAALDFVATVAPDVWVTRQTMTALTVMMVAAEAYGFDTALVEDLDSKLVRQDFAVPDDAEVVAVLAIGHRRGATAPYCGRLPLARTVFGERYGTPLFEEEPTTPDREPEPRGTETPRPF